MSLLNTISGWIKKDRNEMLSFHFDDSHVVGTYKDTPAQAGRHYFRISLVRMFLKKEVHLMKTWFPAAHSSVLCKFGDTSREIPNIADTSKLFKEQQGGNVVATNFMLTPLLPFNGGEVTLVAGLFAMKGDDYLNKVITVMSDFAGLLQVPQLSTAMHVATPLANGLETLFGANDGRMHLGYSNSFVGIEEGKSHEEGTANYLREGYIAVVRVPADELDRDKLWVVDDMLHQGDSLTDNEPYSEHDYILLRIELREERDDFDKLTAIKTPFDNALHALAEQDTEKANQQFRLCMVAAMGSAELTQADKIRVVNVLKERYKEAKKTMIIDFLVDNEYSLQKDMQFAMSLDDALEEGMPTLQMLLTDE